MPEKQPSLKFNNVRSITQVLVLFYFLTYSSDFLVSGWWWGSWAFLERPFSWNRRKILETTAPSFYKVIIVGRTQSLNQRSSSLFLSPSTVSSWKWCLVTLHHLHDDSGFTEWQVNHPLPLCQVLLTVPGRSSELSAAGWQCVVPDHQGQVHFLLSFG